MKKEIAFFDFDGTITSKDTMLVFLRHLSGDARYFLNMTLLSPVFALLQLGIIGNHRAKEIMLSRFIGGMEEQELRKACLRFSSDILPGIIRPAALERIRMHQAQGAEVVVVSAAPAYWVSDWARENQAQLIATKLETADGRITGKISGKNCHGEEKVRRIKERFDLSVYTSVHAYGDTPGDRPMLSLAQHPHYKPFR